MNPAEIANINPVAAIHSEPEPVAVSAAMSEAIAAARDVAMTPTTVLLLGESGSGKDIIARFIHRNSPRSDAPYIAVNCAAMPGDILERELFTPGPTPAEGKTRGTLVLDDISELPPSLQARILRALQERELDRSGGTKAQDVRIIATSNRDLGAMVRQGTFRADLYYRLNVFPIRIPSLRERIEDIPALAEQLVVEAAANMGVNTPRLTAAAISALQAERFPGNVRELGNLIQRAMVRCRGTILDAWHLGLTPPNAPAISLVPPNPTESAYPASLPLDLNALERMAIEEALRRVSGNRTHAARLLGIGLRTLRNKLRQWRAEGIPVPPANDGSKAEDEEAA